MADGNKNRMESGRADSPDRDTQNPQEAGQHGQDRNRQGQFEKTAEGQRGQIGKTFEQGQRRNEDEEDEQNKRRQHQEAA